MADTSPPRPASSPLPSAPPVSPPSFDTAPRLQSASGDRGSAYAPIAWSAVAALGIGGLFVVVLLLYGYSAFRQREPLVAPWLFAFPVFGLVTAFVARRQIAASEGTRIGTPYAVAGWWLCVVGGLIYAAYLATLGYTVRSDAAAAFRAWADKLPAADPDLPDQQALFAAFHGITPPAQRVGTDPAAAGLTDPQRAAARERLRGLFEPALLKFRQNPLLHQAARYKDECRFTAEGMKAWQYQGGKIECALGVRMATPEGDFLLAVPLEATVGRGGREWQVKATDAGITADRRTPFGFLVGEWVTPSAVDAAGQFLLAQKGLAAQRIPLDVLRRAGGADAPQALAAVAGGGPLAADAVPPAFAAFAAGPVVTLPGGAAAPDADQRECRAAWADEPYRFQTAGILPEAMGENPRLPSLQLLPDRVRVSVPCQYKPRKAEAVAREAGVRMRLILECADPEVMRELAAARATAATDPRKPPAELVKDLPALTNRTLIPLDKWTAVRFESDLVVVKPPAAGPGGPGGGQ